MEVQRRWKNPYFSLGGVFFRFLYTFWVPTIIFTWYIYIYISWDPDTWCPKNAQICRTPPPFKNFQLFWPKIFTWLWRYSKILFGARFWGAVCAPTRHICGFPILAPKWRFWAKSAEISGCATWVHPTPKFFGAPKVMTLGYIQHKYLSVTHKTRKTT